MKGLHHPKRTKSEAWTHFRKHSKVPEHAVSFFVLPIQSPFWLNQVDSNTKLLQSHLIRHHSAINQELEERPRTRQHTVLSPVVKHPTVDERVALRKLARIMVMSPSALSIVDGESFRDFSQYICHGTYLPPGRTPIIKKITQLASEVTITLINLMKNIGCLQRMNLQ